MLAFQEYIEFNKYNQGDVVSFYMRKSEEIVQKILYLLKKDKLVETMKIFP
jgi:hypothetical protein